MFLITLLNLKVNSVMGDKFRYLVIPVDLHVVQVDINYLVLQYKLIFL